MSTGHQGADGHPDKHAKLSETSAPRVGRRKHARELDEASTSIRPPAPYAEDAIDEEDVGAQLGPSSGALAQSSSALNAQPPPARDAPGAGVDEQDEDDLRLERGHKEAMNAVMQLAQAAQSAANKTGSPGVPTSEQARAHARVSDTGTAKRKRGQGSGVSAKASDGAAAPNLSTPWTDWSQEAQQNFANLFARDAESGASGDQASEEASARATEVDGPKDDQAQPTPDAVQQPNSADGITMTAGESAVQAENANAETAELLARNGRHLNPSKRAAQNRAAQRAFRLRRDEHVREVERKAQQYDEAMRTAEQHRKRYEDAMLTIEALRADNHSLRVAIEAMGGRAPTPPPRVVASTARGADSLSSTMAPLDAANSAPTAGATPLASATDGDKEEFGGLSAVAAAAAAAAGAPGTDSTHEKQAAAPA